MDQTAELQALIDADPAADFAWASFEVHGQVNLPVGCAIKRLGITVPNWSDNRKVVSIADASGCDIDGLSINIGNAPAQGSIANAFALFVGGGTDAKLSNIEVTGNGKCNAIRLENLIRGVISGINVHDMQWSGTATSEQIVGLWLVSCDGTVVEKPVVKNLLNTRPWQTDGITVSASKRVAINGADIAFCGEGIDISGSNPNFAIEVNDAYVLGADSFGIKLANAPQCCMVRRCRVHRAGYMAFIISGMSEAGNQNGAYGNHIEDCFAIETGFNGLWSAWNTCAIGITQGSYLLSMPTANVVDRLTAYSTTSKYGAVTQVAGNYLWRLSASGQTVGKTLGTWS